MTEKGPPPPSTWAVTLPTAPKGFPSPSSLSRLRSLLRYSPSFSLRGEEKNRGLTLGPLSLLLSDAPPRQFVRRAAGLATGGAVVVVVAVVSQVPPVRLYRFCWSVQPIHALSFLSISVCSADLPPFIFFLFSLCAETGLLRLIGGNVYRTRGSSFCI